MIKSLTFIFSTFVFLSGFSVFAQGNNNNSESSRAQASKICTSRHPIPEQGTLESEDKFKKRKQEELKELDNCIDTQTAKIQTEREKLIQAGSNKDEEKCESAKKDFNEANKKFTEACRSVSNDTSTPKCRKRYETCGEVTSNYLEFSDKIKEKQNEMAQLTSKAPEISQEDIWISSFLGTSPTEDRKEEWTDLKKDIEELSSQREESLSDHKLSADTLWAACPELTTKDFKEDKKRLEEQIADAKKDLIDMQKDTAKSKNAQAQAEQKRKELAKKRAAQLRRTLARLQEQVTTKNERLRRKTLDNQRQLSQKERDIERIINKRAQIMSQKAEKRIELTSSCKDIYQNKLLAADKAWSEKDKYQSQYNSQRQGLFSTSSVNSSKKKFFQKNVMVPYQQCLKKTAQLKKVFYRRIENDLKSNESDYNQAMKDYNTLANEQKNNMITFEEQVHNLKKQEANAKQEYEELVQSLKEQTVVANQNAQNQMQADKTALNHANEQLNMATNSLMLLRGTDSRNVASEGGYAAIPGARDDYVIAGDRVETSCGKDELENNDRYQKAKEWRGTN